MAIVYQHRRLDTNEIFYIGIGINKNRAYSKSGRNKHWHNIVNKVGYEVDILIDGCKMSQAKYIEKNMISYIGQSCNKTGKLVNITKGGEDRATNKNRVCVNKNEKEAFIFSDQLEHYINSGWSVGRSLKAKKAIGKSNSISQLGKKLPQTTKEKMRGKRDPYKLSQSKKNIIEELYKTKTIEEISKIVDISFPTILRFLKDFNIYSKKRKIKICPHCNISGVGPNMTRYHFENCKNKIT
jgi:hypothetical protein